MSRLRTGRADRLVAIATVGALLGACSTNDRPLPAEAPLDRPTTPVALAPIDDPKLGPLGGPSRNMMTACAARLGAPISPPDESRARGGVDGIAPLSRSILVTPPLGAPVPPPLFNQWTFSVTGSAPNFVGTGIRMYEGGAPTANGQLFTRQINNQNVVLVDVDTPTPNDYASHLWTESGGYVALPRLAGATFNAAQGLNDLGTVVGYASLPPNTVNTSNATAWRYTPAGGIEALGWPVGANGSWAFSVNESGVIAGYARVNGVLQLARWTPGSGWTVLGAAQAGRRTFGLDINDNGVMTGYVVSTSGERAFVWTPGTGFTVLGQPDGATRTLGIAIDNSGGVAGYSIRADGSAFGWYWKNGTFTPTGTLGESTFVTDVSNDGIVTGYSFLPGAGDYHAFAYRSQSDELIDLGKHIQACSSVGFAVNDILRVAGMNFIDPTPDAGLRWLALWDLTPNDGPTGGQLPPVTEVEGHPVTLTATGVADPNGDPLTYVWTFGDGSPTVTTTEPTVDHVYKDNGGYAVSVEVRDGRGGSRTVTSTATITNAPPVPAITPITADLSCTGDAEVQVVFTDKGVLDATWTYVVDWGDGTQVAGNATSQAELLTLTKSYATSGTFTVTYTVTDKDGASASATTTVTRSCNGAPTEPTVPPVTQVEGHAVTITATGATDPNGDPLTYTWTLGDGSAPVVTTTPSVTYTYKDNGAYPVSVTVSDGKGGSSTATSMATITNAVPVPTVTPGTVALSCTGDAQFSFAFTDKGVLDAPWSYVVSWGDGSPAVEGTVATQGTPLVLSKAYATAGSFTVTYTVTDKDGGSASVTATVTRTCNSGPNTPKYDIGDRVWKDLNRNRVVDANEPGIGGVWVKLLDAHDRIISVQRTTSTGAYRFEDVPAGSYRVCVVGVPGDYVPTTAGDRQVLPIVGAVYCQPVVVTNADRLDIDFGFDCPPLLDIGDLVWKDVDRDGRRDANEPGLADVWVKLFDQRGALIAYQKTSHTGAYRFNNLPAGTYRVCTTGLPAGYQPTQSYERTTISGHGTAYCRTVVLTTTDQLDADFGFDCPPPARYDIGDLVWKDMDRDGRRDSHEPGLGNVWVKLLHPTNTTVLGAQRSTSSGGYLFRDLAPGSYRVCVTGLASNLQPTQHYSRITIPGHGTAWCQAVTLTTSDRLNIDFGFDH